MTDAGFVSAHTHLYSGLAPFDMPAPAEAPNDFVQILECSCDSAPLMHAQLGQQTGGLRQVLIGLGAV